MVKNNENLSITNNHYVIHVQYIILVILVYSFELAKWHESGKSHKLHPKIQEANWLTSLPADVARAINKVWIMYVGEGTPHWITEASNK